MVTNVNAPFGLSLEEEYTSGNLEMCFIPASDGTAVFVGDAVKTAGSSGSILGGPKKRTVTQCAAGDPIYGIVQGFLPHWVASGMDLGIRYRKASTDMYVIVKPANNQDIYRIQCQDSGSTIGDSNIGQNANIVVTAGSTVTGFSGMQVNSGSAANTATLQLKLIGYDDRVSNNPGVANQVVMVRLNNIELSGGTGTAGV